MCVGTGDGTDRLAYWLFDQPSVIARTVAEQFDVEQSTAYRAVESGQTMVSSGK